MVAGDLKGGANWAGFKRLPVAFTKLSTITSNLGCGSGYEFGTETSDTEMQDNESEVQPPTD